MEIARDFGKGRESMSVSTMNTMRDKAHYKTKWTIHTFDGLIFEDKVKPLFDKAGESLILSNYYYRVGDKKKEMEHRLIAERLTELGNAYALSVSEVEGNVLLNEGINALWTLVCGGSETNYSATNARLGVGDSNIAASATQTRLQAVESKTAWAPNTAYSLGAFRRPTVITDNSRFYYEVTTAGTSGASEPSWPTTNGATVNDGSVVWTARERIVFKGMDAGYPTFGTSQKVTWRATFGGAEANFDWNEFTIDNGASAVKNLNRKVSAEGTKIPGQTRVLTLEITLS